MTRVGALLGWNSIQNMKIRKIIASLCAGLVI